VTKRLSNALSLHARQLEDEAPWRWLFDFVIPAEDPEDDPTVYRCTNSTTLLYFGESSAGDPVPYYPVPIAHSEIEETIGGDLPQLTIQVGNPSLQLASIFEEKNGLSGARVVVRLVNSDAMDDFGSQDSFELEVIEAGFDERVLSVKLGGGTLADMKIPPDRYSRYHCSPGRVPYGGLLCGYDLSNPTLLAAFPTCARTKEACRLHGDAEVAASLPRLHPLRFGGRPSIPRQKRT
jgi:hypothetical protein